MTSTKLLEAASEADLHEWITTLGLSLDPEDSLQEQLRDGILLCQLVNRIKPGSVDNVSSTFMPLSKLYRTQNCLYCADEGGWVGTGPVSKRTGVGLPVY